MRLKTASFILILVFSSALFSQEKSLGNLSGTIFFDDNFSAVGVYVALSSENFKKETTTDFDGLFSLNAIPYGTYNLNIQSLNAETKNIEITVDKKQQDLNVILKFTKNKLLKEVVINGKTIKQKIEEKGFAVNVIETKEVAKRNVQTNELLAQTVGVKIRQNGGLGSDIKYYINGLSGNAIRIFIDGIPISTYGSSFSLNSIPPSLIERIEVYKGVVPVIYPKILWVELSIS